MRSALVILVNLLLGVLAVGADPLPVRPVQTFDHARQLLVQGGNFTQRSAVLHLAQNLRETVLKAFGLRVESYPIARPLVFTLRADFPRDSQPRYEVVEDPGGLKVQIQLAPLDGEPPLGVERTVLVLLLTELALRNVPPVAGADRAAIPYPPRWLVDVLLHKHHDVSPVLSPVRLRGVLDAGKIPALEPLLGRPETDWAVSSDEDVDLARTLFWMLSNRDDFKKGLTRLLNADFSRQPLQALQRCFPSLGRSEAELQKEWTLAVASYGTQQEVVSLDGPQTEIQIQRLCQLDLHEPESGRHFVAGLEQFSDYLRFPGITGVLNARQVEWKALRERCHFMYAGVIETYAEVCRSLAQGSTRGVTSRLQAATLERESIAARLDRIHDHLNWFQAVAAPRMDSPRIREFYRLLNVETPVSPAVSQALDRAEKRMKEEAEREDIARVLDEAKDRRAPRK